MHTTLHSSNILMAILADILEHARNPAIARHLDHVWQAVQLPLSATLSELLMFCDWYLSLGLAMAMGKSAFEELPDLYKARRTSPYGCEMVRRKSESHP